MRSKWNQYKWNKTKMESDLNGIRPKQNQTQMELDQNGIQTKLESV